MGGMVGMVRFGRLNEGNGGISGVVRLGTILEKGGMDGSGGNEVML